MKSKIGRGLKIARFDLKDIGDPVSMLEKMKEADVIILPQMVETEILGLYNKEIRGSSKETIWAEIRSETYVRKFLKDEYQTGTKENPLNMAEQDEKGGLKRLEKDTALEISTNVFKLFGVKPKVIKLAIRQAKGKSLNANEKQMLESEMQRVHAEAFGEGAHGKRGKKNIITVHRVDNEDVKGTSGRSAVFTEDFKQAVLGKFGARDMDTLQRLIGPNKAGMVEPLLNAMSQIMYENKIRSINRPFGDSEYRPIQKANPITDQVQESNPWIKAMRHLTLDPLYARSINKTVGLDKMPVTKSGDLITQQDVNRAIEEEGGSIFGFGAGMSGVARDHEVQFGAVVLGASQKRNFDKFSEKKFNLFHESNDISDIDIMLKHGVAEAYDRGESAFVLVTKMPWVHSEAGIRGVREKFKTKLKGEDPIFLFLDNNQNILLIRDGKSEPIKLTQEQYEGIHVNPESRKGLGEKGDINIDPHKPIIQVSLIGSGVGMDAMFRPVGTGEGKARRPLLIADMGTTIEGWEQGMGRVRADGFQVKNGTFRHSSEAAPKMDLVVKGLAKDKSLRDYYTIAVDNMTKVTKESNLGTAFNALRQAKDRLARDFQIEERENQPLKEEMEIVKDEWNRHDSKFDLENRGMARTEDMWQRSLNHEIQQMKKGLGPQSEVYKLAGEKGRRMIDEALKGIDSLTIDLRGDRPGEFSLHRISNLKDAVRSINENYKTSDFPTYTEGMPNRSIHQVVAGNVAPNFIERMRGVLKLETGERMTVADFLKNQFSDVDHDEIEFQESRLREIGAVNEEGYFTYNNAFLHVYATIAGLNLDDPEHQRDIADINQGLSSLPKEMASRIPQLPAKGGRIAPVGALDFAILLSETGAIELWNYEKSGLDFIARIGQQMKPINMLGPQAGRTLSVKQFSAIRNNYQVNPLITYQVAIGNFSGMEESLQPGSGLINDAAAPELHRAAVQRMDQLQDAFRNVRKLRHDSDAEDVKKHRIDFEILAGGTDLAAMAVHVPEGVDQQEFEAELGNLFNFDYSNYGVINQPAHLVHGIGQNYRDLMNMFGDVKRDKVQMLDVIGLGKGSAFAGKDSGLRSGGIDIKQLKVWGVKDKNIQKIAGKLTKERKAKAPFTVEAFDKIVQEAEKKDISRKMVEALAFGFGVDQRVENELGRLKLMTGSDLLADDLTSNFKERTPDLTYVKSADLRQGHYLYSNVPAGGKKATLHYVSLRDYMHNKVADAKPVMSRSMLDQYLGMNNLVGQKGIMVGQPDLSKTLFKDVADYQAYINYLSIFTIIWQNISNSGGLLNA